MSNNVKVIKNVYLCELISTANFEETYLLVSYKTVYCFFANTKHLAQLGYRHNVGIIFEH